MSAEKKFEKRHQIYESNDQERQRAYDKLDCLTSVVKEFLKNTDPFASEGIELGSASVKHNNKVLRFNLTGANSCDERHFRAVKQKLPYFTIKTVFEPRNGFQSHEGVDIRGMVVLEYDLEKRPSFNLAGKFLSMSLIMMFFLLVYLLRLYIKHTEDDSDRFGALYRLFTRFYT